MRMSVLQLVLADVLANVRVGQGTVPGDFIVETVVQIDADIEACQHNIKPASSMECF